MQGLDVDCSMGGRRMPKAHAFAKARLADALVESREWSVEMAGSYPLLAETQGAIRVAHHMWMRYVKYLNTIPYLLCRLNENGVWAEATR